jgi:kynurenine 3-monooxygenase
MSTIVINGGGLVGALAAAMLVNKPGVAAVEVFEKRSDIRNPLNAESGRSINLIITSRGLFALRRAGLAEAALKLCVPVRGRQMHFLDGSERFQPYGVAPNEVNYSVSRTALNALLIDEAERRGAKFHFKHSLVSMDFVKRVATYNSAEHGEKTVTATAFLGTDGVASATRQFIVQALRRDGVNVEDRAAPLGISYKELSFPSKNGEYQMDGSALHIWPRGHHFLMALADQGGSFTGTIYLPDGFAELKGIPTDDAVPTFKELDEHPDKLEPYISRYYPDLSPKVPDVANQLKSHHAGKLATIHCSHWNYGGTAVVFGDASHGVVPFFGQGMNCGFESFIVLERLLDTHGYTAAGFEAAFPAFTKARRPDSEAIASMAEENFVEMSFKVSQESFLKRKAIENAIEKEFPHLLRSRYYMVVATLIPYSIVKEAGPHVDACIDDILAELNNVGAHATGDGARFTEGALAGLSRDFVKGTIEKHLQMFFSRHGIDLAHPLKEFY